MRSKCNTRLDSRAATNLGYASVRLAVTLCLEWRMPGDELEAEDTQRPQIHPLQHSHHIHENLRNHYTSRCFTWSCGSPATISGGK